MIDGKKKNEDLEKDEGQKGGESTYRDKNDMMEDEYDEMEGE